MWIRSTKEKDVSKKYTSIFSYASNGDGGFSEIPRPHWRHKMWKTMKNCGKRGITMKYQVQENYLTTFSSQRAGSSQCDLAGDYRKCYFVPDKRKQ